MLSRRAWLCGVGAGALVGFTRRAAAPADRLQRAIADAVGGRNIGVDAARLLRDGDSAREVYRVGVNQDALRPTASCFKAWVALYYYTLTPPDDWDDSPGTYLYRTVVNSQNVATGQLIAQVGELQPLGNALEKFNDFLLYGMGLQHGIASWNWEGNPLVGLSDPRFAPGGERVVRSGGATHSISNVTSAADTLNGYRELFRRTFATDPDIYGGDIAHRRRAALRTMRLLRLPGDDDYESPVERVLGRGVYVGKDGVLPTASTTAGRVINDAGLIPMERGVIALAFFSVGESEFTAVEVLRQILTAIYETERELEL